MNRSVRIALEGKNKREFLGAIRHQFDEIHRSLNDPSVMEMMPCICPECKTGKPHLFAYKTLEAYIDKGIKEIRCERSLENVSIKELLNEVLEPAEGIGAQLGLGLPTYMIHRVENLYTSGEGNMKPSSTRVVGRNPWLSGSFYLFALIVVIAALLAAGKVLSPIWVPVVVVGGLLLITVVGAFQLVNDARLKERGFLELMKLTFQQIPILGRLAGRRLDAGSDR